MFFAWYTKASSPWQSDLQISEWYNYFENDVPNTKKLQKYLQGEIDLLHLIDKRMSDFEYKKLQNV